MPAPAQPRDWPPPWEQGVGGGGVGVGTGGGSGTRSRAVGYIRGTAGEGWGYRRGQASGGFHDYTVTYIYCDILYWACN